ncbi:MAG TPA: GAF domain-containing protein, partial [Anaerolineaceae bacterium]|nr:GAF domain-containing protein [Anaerolineaceae bacterium]
MTITPNFDSLSEWKQYLRLGERLLEQPSVEKQCLFITETIKQLLGAEARVWLSEPYFPLPGEENENFLPNASVSDLVRKTFDQQLQNFESGNNAPFISFNNSSKPTHITIPLISQDNMLGILEVKRSKGHFLDQQEMEFLEGFTAHAAVSMQIIRQVSIKNWHLDQLSLVRQVSEQVANVLELKLLCKRVSQLIQSTFGYYFVAIFLLNGKTKQLELKASSSVINLTPQKNPTNLDINEGLVGYVARTGKEIIASDVSQEKLYKHYSNLPDTRSEATFPLKIDKKTLGVLDIQSDKLNAFSENDIVVFNALANSIAIAVQGADLYG